MERTRFTGLTYLAIGMGWKQDLRIKTGKLWRIKDGYPFHILVEKFGYTVVVDYNFGPTVLTNTKDGSYVVLGARDYFLCDKIYARRNHVNLIR
jgi:hypothetical protein